MAELAFRKNFTLQLPSSFVDMKADEMEYIDGGMSGTDFALGVLATVVGNAIGRYVTLTMVRTALTALGGWVANTFYSVAVWAAFNPVAAGAVLVGIASAVGGYVAWRYYH